MIMKKQIISWGMMLAAAFTLTNCAEEIENPNQQPEKQGYPYEIVASPIDTKTVNEGMSTKWDDNDAINLFHAEAESEVYGTNDKFTIADVETGRFTGTLTEVLEAGKSYDWYALYPYNSNIATPGDRADGFTYIGHSKGLNQTGYDNMASLKETICPLYGVAKAVSSSDTPSITMNHLTSVVAIKVTNTTEEPLTITTASLTAEEDIVGSYYIDITQSPVVYKASEGYVKNTAIVNVSDGTALAKGKSATLYLAIKPFTAEAGTSLTLSVNDYAKDPKVLTSDVTFHAGKIKTLNFAYDYVAPAGEKTVTFDFTKNEWKLPVSTSDAGDAGNILEPVVSGEVTMTVENGDASNETRLWEGSNGIDLRAYNGSSLSFSVPSGHVITKMTFTGGKVADNLFETVTGTYSSKVWSGSANPLVLNILGTVNVETITIEYGLGEPEAPKTKQELSFPESSYSIVMGEPFTAPVLSGAMTDVTYSSSKEEVATVGDNGAVTLVGPGTTVITATAAADETYASASAAYTLVVNAAPSSSVLSLPWNEDFSGDLSSYTILNGGGTTAIQTSGTMYAGGEGNELLIAKGNGSLAAKISTGGYTGTLTLTFKSNHADYLEVTSETSGVEVYKNTDTEYIINISKSMDTFVIALTNVKSSNTRVDDISMVKGGDIPEINIPTYASLSALVAAGEPTAEGTKVTVTLTNEKITGIYTTSSGYRNGVFLQVGEQEIEIYSKDVPDAWVEGGTISGTLTECDWKLYNTTWELCPANWSELTYTAPAGSEPENPGTGGENTGGTHYVKVTSAPTDWSGTYLIVYESGNVAFDGGLQALDAVGNTVNVNISDNKIEADDATNAASFTINASGHIQSASGYYIGQTSNANGLKSNKTTKYTNTLSLDSNGTVNIVSGGAYLRYNAASDQTRFRYYKSSSYTNQKAIALYKLQ